MNMSAEHNSNFLHGVLPQSFNQYVVSFQSGNAINGTGLILGGMSTSGGINGPTGTISGNSSMLNNNYPVVSAANSQANVKYRTAFAVDWTSEELEVLKEGLATNASEPNIMKYIRIASRLPDKTVRDVAMRCRWITKKESSKRHKPGDCYIGKKTKDKKPRLAPHQRGFRGIICEKPEILASTASDFRRLFFTSEIALKWGQTRPISKISKHFQEKDAFSSSMANMQCNTRESTTAPSFMMYNGDCKNQFSCQAPAIYIKTRHLLDDNVKLFHRIARNLESNKFQTNIDLLYRSKENIAAILDSMSGMPGIMSQMPPLPVHINENLMHFTLRGIRQARASVISNI